MEGSTGGIAGFLRGDRSSQAELGMRCHVFVLSAGGRGAEIHVLVPLRDAERDALIEFVFAHALGSGVHYTDQFVVIVVLFIKQRRRVLGIETEGCFHGVAVVGEVVHLLAKFGMENLVAVGQGGVVIGVLF